jgi:hypothetical protein
MRKLCKVSEGLNGFSMEKPMRQIVYFSTATSRQDAPTIAALLAVSGDFPGGEKITGLLVAGGHRYLQVIEGPALTAEAVLEPIRRHPCHVGLTVLVNRKITARSFAGGMAYFDEPDLGDFATLKQLIDRMRAKVSERKLRDQINCFERRFTVASLAPVASPWTLADSYASALTFDRGH